MLTHPFPLLRQFERSLDVRFLTRGDVAQSDDDIARLTNASSVASLWQMHGNKAVVVREQTSRTLQADALFTDTPDLTLTIRFADCQNLIVYEPKKKIVGLIHAGWRGMCKKIITNAFVLLKKEWGIEPGECFVAAGPSLCTNCADFTDPQTEAPELSKFIRGNCIDLRAAADEELRLLGVPDSQMERDPDCTRCNPGKYWTYRGGDREKVKEGLINCLAVTLK
jgi:YfiH family protein